MLNLASFVPLLHNNINNKNKHEKDFTVTPYSEPFVFILVALLSSQQSVLSSC